MRAFFVVIRYHLYFVIHVGTLTNHDYCSDNEKFLLKQLYLILALHSYYNVEDHISNRLR